MIVRLHITAVAGVARIRRVRTSILISVIVRIIEVLQPNPSRILRNAIDKSRSVNRPVRAPRMMPVPIPVIRRTCIVSSCTTPHPVSRRKAAHSIRRQARSAAIPRSKLARRRRARTTGKSRRSRRTKSPMKRGRRMARKSAAVKSASTAAVRTAVLSAHRKRNPQQQRNYGKTPHVEILLPCMNGRTSRTIRAPNSPSFLAAHVSRSSTL